MSQQTNFAAIWHIFKFSAKFSLQTPYLIPTVSVRPWIVRQQSSWMGSLIFSAFSVILLVLGHPERLSSLTDTQRECHSKAAIWLKECSPKASRRISRVSVAGLPSFTQNLMQTHCSILPFTAEKMKHEVKKALL
jgi:hypothetical protein